MTSSRLLFLYFGFLIFANSQGYADEVYDYDEFLDSEKKFRIFWKFNETFITIELQVNTTGWVGIGISPNGDMSNADIHVGWVKDGQAYITDRHGQPYNGFPPLDEEQNIELIEGRECDGVTMIKFRRQLAACEEGHDRPITKNTIRLIYAFGVEDPEGVDLSFIDIHRFQDRGTKSIIFLERQKHQVLNDESLAYFEIRNDGTTIPSRSTYYHCLVVEMPEMNATHHIVKIEPVIDDRFINNVHHIVIYACPGIKKTGEFRRQAECYVNLLGEFDRCWTILTGWAIGGGPVTLPKHVGYPIGVEGESGYFKLEIHYDNPYNIEINDTSGIRLTYTPNLRRYEAGVMTVGHSTSGFNLIIPPDTDSFDIFGDCDSPCIANSMEIAGVESIKIFNLFLHSHLAGRAITLRHIRNGTELPAIADDQTYDFDFQEPRAIIPERVVRKGDTLQTHCRYSSKGKHFIQGGLSTSQEMCLSFFFYYPKIPLEICLSSPRSGIAVISSMLGISGLRWINQFKGAIRSGLDDLIITSPIEMANQTLGSAINEHEWTKESADHLSRQFSSSIRTQTCIGPQPLIPVISTRSAVSITERAQAEETLMCVSPSSGLSTSHQAEVCNSANHVISEENDE